GTVDDPAATVQVSNGGTSVVAIVQADGSFSVLIPLIEGRNTLAVRATDRAGNIGTASVVVTLDTSPPALTISSPAQDTLLGPGSSSVTVEGTVDDPTSRIEIANGPVSVPATVGAGGRFQ